MSSSTLLSLNPSLLHRPQHSSETIISLFPTSKPSLRSLSRSHISFSLSSSSSSSNSSSYEREEARWLREEQRWLREEQRWLREESRWKSERESLLREIADLRLQVEELERRGGSIQGASVSETVASVAGLLKLLKDGDLGQKLNRIAESGSSAVPLVVEAAETKVEEEEEEVVVKEVVRVSERKEGKEVRKRGILRKGCEGDDVGAMQEALQKLGFYSGEEDMEFSSFSSGTERAVKTWQASLGIHEDGIMTAELLEMLYEEEQIGVSGSAVNEDTKEYGALVPKDDTNGAAVVSVTEISEIEQTAVEQEGIAEVEVSEHRVFLLGENRWEDSSRLSSRKKQDGGTKNKDGTTKCLSCRGEGRLLCTECDGSGEPNIEEQFCAAVFGMGR